MAATIGALLSGNDAGPRRLRDGVDHSPVLRVRSNGGIAHGAADTSEQEIADRFDHDSMGRGALSIACAGCPRPVSARFTVPNRANRHINEEGNFERLPGDRRRRHQNDHLGGAAADAINTARQSVRDLPVAEVVKQDIHVGDGGELIFRTKIQLFFKYEQES
jgi:flavin-binding protein dodecin